jgi:AcrR family transcriptional regulator
VSAAKKTPADRTATAEAKPPAARKPRADALHNRERLLATAKAAFAEAGPDVSLEIVARRAKVGIGTLYRHFPTRDALLEAVYRREVQQLADAAPRLLDEHLPLEALRAWMLLFVDYIAAKRVIAPSLLARAGGASEVFAATGTAINGALDLLVGRARAAGVIRSDVGPRDLMRGLVGAGYASEDPGWQASARRLIDVLADGLRTDARRIEGGESP